MKKVYCTGFIKMQVLQRNTVYWRDGFYVALNYSSENYAVNLPEAAKILIKKNTKAFGRADTYRIIY